MTVQCEVRINQGLQAHVDAGVVLDKSFGFRSSQWLDCKKIVYVACQSFELLAGRLGCGKVVGGKSEVVWAGGVFFAPGVSLLGCRRIVRVLPVSELFWLKISCLCQWLELTGTHRHRASAVRGVWQSRAIESSTYRVEASFR